VPRPLEIAFLACNKNPDRFREDPSFRYRCDNLAEALKQLGQHTHCEHVSRWRWRQPLDVAVLHRPLLTAPLWLALRRLKRRGVRVVMDVDDLVFDPAVAPWSPAVLSHRASRWGTACRYALHQQALQHADVLTTSTQPLLEALRQLPGLAARACWIANAVHHRWLAMDAQPLPVAAGAGEPVLRYLPGTRSHDADFAQIQDALVTVLRERPAVRLEIIGPLACDLPLPAWQWSHRPKLPFDRYHEVVRSAYLNLAPLAINRFNQAKSALKVIEAAYWGVPTLCSPVADTLRLQDAGALVCHDAAHWVAQLSRLLDDPGQRQQAGAGLRPAILRHADVHHWAQVWLDEVGLPASSGYSTGRVA
jgi:glycosyltransferase involved in cell wall biosynthesis